MNALADILEHTREEIRRRKREAPISLLEQRPAFHSPRRSLTAALRTREFSVIAEIKRASPSRGTIREEFDPVAIAGDYERNGASALSILTEEKFFRGSPRYIEQVRPFSLLPILRKDFVLDPYQLHESRAIGADAVLLIAAVLGQSALRDLYDEADALGLESLIEVHTREEIEGLQVDAPRIVGINNRNLSTFETNLDTTFDLKRHVPQGALLVSESGISTPEHVRKLKDHGVTIALIGESLMRSENPGEALRLLLSLVGAEAGEK